MSESFTLLRMLSSSTVEHSRLKVRFFGPTISKDLKGFGGLCTKWSATAIDRAGDTALIFKNFFGSDSEREENVKKHCAIYADGCIVVINSSCKSQGCVGSPKVLLHNSTSALTTLEITPATRLSVQVEDDASIPWRPKISRTLFNMKVYNFPHRVNVCGVVKKVTSDIIEDQDGKEARDFIVVEIIDDSATGAHLILWTPFNTYSSSDLLGRFLVAYNMQFVVESKGIKLQSTDDTTILQLLQPDKVNRREDAMIDRASQLQFEVPSTYLTFFESCSTQQAVPDFFRHVCVQALSLAAKVRDCSSMQGFRLQGVYCRMVGAAISSHENCLWTEVSMSDASGRASVIATEKALLGMSGLSKEKFIEECNSGILHLHRTSVRVSRSHLFSAGRSTLPSLVLEDASPQFLLSADTSAPSPYSDPAIVVDPAAILPATLKTLRCIDDEHIQVCLEADPSRTVDALGGVTLLLQATCDQEPDYDGNNAVLRYKDMIDIMTGEKCHVIWLLPLKSAIRFLLTVGAFALFHVTKRVKDGLGTAFFAENVYKASADENVEQAKIKFAAEIATSAAIFEKSITSRQEGWNSSAKRRRSS